MRTRTALAIGALLLTVATAVSWSGDFTRYRGQYTFGHEVNVFCPAINSQCYWLSGDTPSGLRAALRRLAESRASEPYEPVCVVVDAAIDRGSPRTGFAADYDGLVTISRLYGPCSDTPIVTPGDLQHHRWVLEAVDGQALQSPPPGERVPDLDFGEQMRVSGNTGCNSFTGTAVLRGENLVVERMITTGRLCGPAQDELELLIRTVLGSESRIRLHPDNALLLESSTAVLRFRLRDWVR